MNQRNKAKQLLRTLLTTGTAYAVNYGILLVLTPYITETVGAEAYGFVSLAKQFATYATVVTMALNTFAVRYISVAYHKGDNQQAEVYASSVFWGDLILATGILATTSVVIGFLEHFLSIPTEILTDVKLLFFVTFLGFWVSTVFSVFECAGYIKNRLDLAGVFKTIAYLANVAIMLVLFWCLPDRVFYVGLGNLGAILVTALSGYWMTRTLTPDLRIRRKRFSMDAVKKLVIDGCWASFNSVGELLNNGLDLLIGNQLLSSLAMGQIAIAKTLYSIIQGLYLLVDQMFIPMFLRSYAESKKERLLTELKFSMKLSGLMVNVAFAGFAALGLVYFRLWIPGQDIQLIYKLTVVTLLGCIPSGALHPLYYIYTLTLKKKIPCYVTLIGGVFNLTGMYVLIQYFHMGVYAVAWTTVAVMAVINFVTNPLYMAHVLEIPLGTFYPSIIKNVISCAALTGLYQLFARWYLPHSWSTLILTAIVYAILGIPVHLGIVCSREEWGMLLGMIKRRNA